MGNYAFIDSTNLHMSIQSQGWTLDYVRFRKYLSDKYKVSKAFLFLGYLPTHADLYKSLQEAGFVLVFKPTLEIKGKIKGNADAELVLQAMIEYPNYEQAVIVTGNGNPHRLVKYLASKKKLHKLIVPNKRRYSSLLRKFSPYISGLNGLMDKLGTEKEA